MSQRMYRIGTMVRMNKFKKMSEPVKNAIKSWNIVTGDTVQIMEGRDAGKRGVVERVFRKRNLVFIKGLKKGLRFTKPTEENGNTKLLELKERGIHYSNVLLIDPVTKKPTRVTSKRDENGKYVRVAARSGAIIPKPAQNWTVERPVNSTTDTLPGDVLQQTYVIPEWLSTFIRNKHHEKAISKAVNARI